MGVDVVVDGASPGADDDELLLLAHKDQRTGEGEGKGKNGHPGAHRHVSSATDIHQRAPMFFSM
jgi:hypothetical protein